MRVAVIYDIHGNLPALEAVLGEIRPNAAERIRGTPYPQAQESAAQNVLQPSSDADMLEAFAKAELR
jgi:hypothetical protein